MGEYDTPLYLYTDYVPYIYVLNLNYIDNFLCGLLNGQQTVFYGENTANLYCPLSSDPHR